MTASLGLDAAGVAVERSGKVIVDEYQYVGRWGILCGRRIDVNELDAHRYRAGRRLADRLGGLETAKLEYENVLTVAFSHPPIGTIGLTEPAAREVRRRERHRLQGASSMYVLEEEMKKPMAMKLVCGGGAARRQPPRHRPPPTRCSGVWGRQDGGDQE